MVLEKKIVDAGFQTTAVSMLFDDVWHIAVVIRERLVGLSTSDTSCDHKSVRVVQILCVTARKGTGSFDSRAFARRYVGRKNTILDIVSC